MKIVPKMPFMLQYKLRPLIWCKTGADKLALILCCLKSTCRFSMPNAVG